MLYSEIKDDAKLVFGDCDGATLRRRVTEALEVLGNLGDANWDGLTGEMTICVDSLCGTVTLPREVLKPISINIDTYPTFPRDKWFEYHLNGPGSCSTGFRGAWDERGEHPVCREPTEATYLKITAEHIDDEGKTITFVYMDEDDRQREATVTLDPLDPVITDWQVKQIVAVGKDTTVGDVRVYYEGDESVLAGWYAPEETNPLYRRIKVSAKKSVQMIYRRRSMEITGDSSYIPLRSKMAIMKALWAIKKSYQGDLDGEQSNLAQARIYLEQDRYARSMMDSPIGGQVLDYSDNNNERLRGGSWCGRGFAG